MVINNPNNWHWVDKNCLQWSKEYFDQKFTDFSVQDDHHNVQISEVSSVEGDVDVSQRKGKVISLFDIRIVLSFKGTIDDEEVNGSITIPELAFDTDIDDIQFDINVYNENAKNSDITSFIKKQLIPKLRDVLIKFGPDLIEINSKDIQLSSDKVSSTLTKQNQATITSTTTTPVVEEKKPVVITPIAKSPTPTKSSSPGTSGNIPKYNTTTLHLDTSFNTTAEQIYITLLDESRIGAWTRSYPQIEKFPPSPGSEFKFFGGAVSGKIVKLVPNEEITQLWRLEDWKSGHFAELNMKLVQTTGETNLIVKFTGVPIGEEERVKNNFEEMYIRSIKITFGFGAVL
ncbi:AHA1 [[Candida] subhashii]|uniref:AHA1 n=1 Tax=[Candida] subhashii TaxID=561895 RepID=A0A8J5UNE5_9ASCO|nr:AHA1 [[Candida] subhashii]KAG7663781.1 AHA1 [[Candida] subhashii]